MALVYLIALGMILWGATAVILWDDLGDFSNAALSIAGTLMAGSLGCLGYGLYTYLRHGEWGAISVGFVMDLVLGGSSPSNLHTNWVGLNKIGGYVLSMNAGWVFLALAFLQLLALDHWSKELQIRKAAASTVDRR